MLRTCRIRPLMILYMYIMLYFLYNFCSCDIKQIYYDKIVITSLLFFPYGNQNFLVAEEEKEGLGLSHAKCKYWIYIVKR